MQFKFNDGCLSGYLAFTGPTASRRLLVTDAGHDAVHVIDVVGRVHAGYVAAPGTLAGPRGVAARGTHVAVSVWKAGDSGDHVVHLFRGSGPTWTPVRVLGGGFGAPGVADGQLARPYGLRFTGDGTGLAVVDTGNGRACLFRVADGSFVQHVASRLSGPRDLERCEGGWLIVCWASHTVELAMDKDVDGGAGGVGRTKLGKSGCEHGELSRPSALTLVPGLGLVVREAGNERVQVFG
jgi:hypothetical protein